MKLSLFSLSAALTTGFALGTLSPEITEPPLGFVLTIDGNEVRASVGEKFELNIGDQKHSCTVEVEPTRQFDFRGVRLLYPAHFTFEHDDEDENVELFTVEGTETVVMLQVFNDDLAPSPMLELIVEATAAEYGGFDVEREDVELELGGRTYVGQSLTVDLGEEMRFRQTFVSFGLPENTCILMLQGNLDEWDDYSPECSKAFAVVADTLQLAE